MFLMETPKQKTCAKAMNAPIVHECIQCTHARDFPRLAHRAVQFLTTIPLGNFRFLLYCLKFGIPMHAF